MTQAERVARARVLADTAMTLPHDQQAAFLAAASGDDADLRAEAGALLAARQRVTVLMEDSSAAPVAVVVGGAAAGDAGLVIDGYAIVRELSRGGQGIVYEAIQESTHRRVAIKILLEGQHASAGARRRFQREVELVAQLRHPHIISVFHTGFSAQGHPFYVMDFVAGIPLGEYVQTRQLTVEATLELFATICDAVQHAHQRGIIHLDLKPPNILIESDGTPRILDFGLARPLAESARDLTVTRGIVGTLPYLAPEQAGGGGELDTRTDIYALGIILYELLTGHRPYPVGERLPDVLRHICETPSAPLRKSWTCDVGVRRRSRGRVRIGECPIDADLESIAAKALAKEPSARYQSAGEFARDIRHYLRGEPIEARADAIIYVLWKQSRRYFRRKPAVVLALVLAVLAPGFAAAVHFWRQAVRERDVAEAAIGFLNSDVFGPLDPEQRGRAVDLRALLDAAAGKVDARFADAPLAEASIRNTLGNLYASIGAYAPAREQLARAVRLRRSELGGAHPAVAESLVNLARAQEGVGALAEAERSLQAALAVRTDALGRDDALTVETVAELAAFARRRGDLERAAQLAGGPAAATPAPATDEAAARARLAEAVSQHGDGHPEVAARLVDVADIVARRGELEKAEGIYLEALRIWTEQFGPEHPRARATFARLERSLVAGGRTEQLVPLVQERLARALQQDTNAELLSSAAWDVAKQPGYPADLYGQAVKAAEAACRLAPRNGSYTNTLGVALYRAGRFAEALSTLQASDALNSGHPADIAFLAMTQARIGRKAEAQRERTRLIATIQREPWASDAQSQGFLRETEQVLAQPDAVGPT